MLVRVQPPALYKNAMAYNYVKKFTKEKRLEQMKQWIGAFISRENVFPSYNTISKEFGISRTTTYALMNELLATNKVATTGVRNEDDYLPLPAVYIDEKVRAAKGKKKTNLSSACGKIEGKKND